MSQACTYSDIDSLTLAVRDSESKRLIEEAIAAYRGGALRSAVVSTWIAVAYDLIAKLRELASQGEVAPKAFVKDLDKAIQVQDIRKLQMIENQLLQKANSEFKLLAPHELIALERLYKDRNLCAHPAFAMEDELYRPSPELVRSHIVHAMQYLLLHAPLQGKSAIKRFEADILSPSFPVVPQDIESFICSGYLDRAKDVLVVNLIKAILAAPFGSDYEKFTGRNRILAIALRTISKAKAEIYEVEAPKIVSAKFEQINDEVLLNICPFLEQDQRIWDWLPRSACMRIKRLLETADGESLKIHSAFDAFAIESLETILLSRFEGFDYATQISIIGQHPRKQFVKSGIELFAASSSFREAENLGNSIVIPLASYFHQNDIKVILEAASSNGQIWNADGMPGVLENLFDLTAHLRPKSDKHWRAFVENQIEVMGKAEDHYAYPGLQERLSN